MASEPKVVERPICNSRRNEMPGNYLKSLREEDHVDVANVILNNPTFTPDFMAWVFVRVLGIRTKDKATMKHCVLNTGRIVSPWNTGYIVTENATITVEMKEFTQEDAPAPSVQFSRLEMATIAEVADAWLSNGIVMPDITDVFVSLAAKYRRYEFISWPCGYPSGFIRLTLTL